MLCIPERFFARKFLAPLNLKPYSLAKKLHIPRTRIERLVGEVAPVTPDTALRLAKFFGTTAEFWMSMQAAYDLDLHRRLSGAEFDTIERLDAAA
jgi:addiction module HigA family antidote